MSYKKKITILGATGSIGQNTMDLVLSKPEQYDVLCVTAHQNVMGLAETAIKLKAQKAIIADKEKESQLKALLQEHKIKVESGAEKIEKAAGKKQDLVVAGIIGFAGLRPIIKALENGNNVALANKEPLVAAGHMIMALARNKKAQIIPVDSEHNAIFQVFETHNRSAIDKIILTASGGPFLKWPKEKIENASVEEALAHPNWVMGKKISIDSATMMNKALEIIEAAHLFDMPASKIEVLIHPESIVHSMVSYTDGSVLAQMGASDMRTPIAYALGWPKRIETCGQKLDLKTLSSLTFKAPNFEKFPALRYAYKCLELGQAACISFNAANELVVEEFLQGNIAFGDIMKHVAYAVDHIHPQIGNGALKTIEDIEKLDQTVRQEIKTLIKNSHAA